MTEKPKAELPDGEEYQYTVAQHDDQNFIVIRCWLADYPNCFFLSAVDVENLAKAVKQSRELAKEAGVKQQLGAIGVMLHIEPRPEGDKLASMSEMVKEGRGPLQ